jgi:DNA-binding response OmpR family regulator
MIKILLVTNDTGVVSAWQKLLTDSGYHMDVALSAEEAIERSSLDAPRLILLSKVENAAQTLVQQLKQHPVTAAIPVITRDAAEINRPDVILTALRTALIPRRILIAEDDRQMASILSMILEKSGFEVKTTYDGVETLHEIKSWHPHLLVLDVMLPVIDGFHICQTMNEDASFDPVPKVLIISGRSSDWDQNLGAACGAEYYLVKPFSNALFLEKVKEIIQTIAND